MTTGSAAALLISNTVFAMVMTLLAFLIVPVALSATMREHYLAPTLKCNPSTDWHVQRNIHRRRMKISTRGGSSMPASPIRMAT
ncbi:hypothetical protein ACETU7_20085 [Rhodococcus sp. 3Y1]